MNFPNYGIEIYHENGLKYTGRFGDRYGQIFAYLLGMLDLAS